MGAQPSEAKSPAECSLRQYPRNDLLNTKKTKLWTLTQISSRHLVLLVHWSLSHRVTATAIPHLLLPISRCIRMIARGHGGKFLLVKHGLLVAAPRDAAGNDGAYEQYREQDTQQTSSAAAAFTLGILGRLLNLRVASKLTCHISYQGQVNAWTVASG